MGVTVNNKYSRIFGDYASCTAYEVSNFPATTNYEIAGGSINTYMPTTIFANSYNLYLNENSYVKYASSSYSLVDGTYVYSYATFDGFLSTYGNKVDEQLAMNDDTTYIVVAKNGSTDATKTATAIAYVDLKIDINY